MSEDKVKTSDEFVATGRGTVLPATLFRNEARRPEDKGALVVAITGIHGNFWSNPFYYNFGGTLAAAGFDFLYAETSDARGQVRTMNVRTGEPELMGSFNEDFANVDDDVDAYVRWAREQGYASVILAGHSLGANKVIHYLSTHHDRFVSRFVLLSPANLDFLLGQVDGEQRAIIDRMVQDGLGGKMLPFDLFGWAPMRAGSAWRWIHDNPLDSVHLDDNRDFSQVEHVTQSGALFMGTRDAFALGDPERLVRVTNAHFPRAEENRIVLIPGTGHTYQQAEQYTADRLLEVVSDWCTEERGRAVQDRRTKEAPGCRS